MDIETPNLAQPETQPILEDDLEVIFWKETGYEDKKSDLERRSVEYKEPGNCNMTKATLNDPADFLCTTNPGDSCTDPSAEEMPKGGTARPLVSTYARDGMESGRNKFDLVFGIQAKISKTCISNDNQEALFIPVSGHTHWIQNEVSAPFGRCLVDKMCRARSTSFRIQADVWKLFYWMTMYCSNVTQMFVASTLRRHPRCRLFQMA